MTVPWDLQHASKAQWIRVADVFLVGPLMIWGGTALGGRHPVAGVALGLMGVGTIALNGWNFYRLEEARRDDALRQTPVHGVGGARLPPLRRRAAR